MNASLSLVVLRTAKLDDALAFYGALGLEFVREQHGTGPVHFSCKLADTVLELYPGKDGVAPERGRGGATMLGFKVRSVDEAVAAVERLGAQIVTGPIDSARGRRAVISDGDGRAIELTQ